MPDHHLAVVTEDAHVADSINEVVRPSEPFAIEYEPGTIGGFVISPDGERLLVGGTEGVRSYDLADGRLVDQPFAGFQLATDQKRQVMAVSGLDGTISGALGLSRSQTRSVECGPEFRASLSSAFQHRRGCCREASRQAPEPAAPVTLRPEGPPGRPPQRSCGKTSREVRSNAARWPREGRWNTSSSKFIA